MNEFIYSIEEMFSSDGVLTLNQVNCYYIAPYQRGYKWASITRYDQVPQLLIDVYDAYKRNISEYYLQYVTLMKQRIEENGDYVFEVIDGQQRLTTLSLLFYCLDFKSYGENIAKDKLTYYRYNYNINIFNTVIDDIISAETGNYNISDADTQDKFYMENAASCICTFFDILSQYNELQKYIDYLKEHVKIIVNMESEYVKPEEVFSNLNDNKVPLTNAELIKGLLLTLGVEREDQNNRHKHYKEILDQRAIMGRMWDEINAWIEQPKVCQFFFGTEMKGMEHLLSLIHLPNTDTNTNSINCVNYFTRSLNDGNNNDDESSFMLFERFNEVVSSTTVARQILVKLKHVYRTLQCIYENYEDAELYNHLGYFFFAKREKKLTLEARKNTLQSLLGLSDKDKLLYLKDQIIKIMPCMALIKEEDCKNEREVYSSLKYRSSNSSLTNLLLSFSVFPEDVTPTYRFNFYQYDIESWSFEHIFPQHPKSSIKIAEEARVLVSNSVVKEYDSLLHSNDEENASAKEKIMNLLNNIKDGSKIAVNEGLNFLYDIGFDIDSVGNMALLSGGANSALSNNPFIAKRPILSRKIAEGFFVPKHTIDIFHKSLNSVANKPFNMELTVWEQEDIDAHIAWMEKRNSEILAKMNKL